MLGNLDVVCNSQPFLDQGTTRVAPGYRTRNRSQSTSWRCSSAAGQFDHFDFHHNQTHQNNWLPLGNHLSLGIIALVYTSLLDSSIHSLSFFWWPRIMRITSCQATPEFWWRWIRRWSGPATWWDVRRKGWSSELMSKGCRSSNGVSVPEKERGIPYTPKKQIYINVQNIYFISWHIDEPQTRMVSKTPFWPTVLFISKWYAHPAQRSCAAVLVHGVGLCN